MPDKLREKRNKFTEKFLRLPRMKAAFEDAWYLHGRMFGPIMEPAFVGEIAARFRLVSALNLISRGEVFTGMRRLDRLYEYCRISSWGCVLRKWAFVTVLRCFFPMLRSVSRSFTWSTSCSPSACTRKSTMRRR